MLSNKEISSLAASLDVDVCQLKNDFEKLASYDVDAETAKPTLRLKYGSNETTIFDIRGISTIRGHFLFSAGYKTTEKIARGDVTDLASVKYMSKRLGQQAIDSAQELRSESETPKSRELPDESKPDTSESIPIQDAVAQQTDATVSSAPFTAGKALVEATPPVERKDQYPGTCGFVFDPDAWSEEGRPNARLNVDRFEDDVWRCPHHAPENGDYCIFHQSPKKKDNDEVIERFIDEITQKSNNQLEKQFIGAQFSELDLSKEIIDPDDTYTIDLQHVTVLGKMNFEGARFKNAIDVSHSRLEGGIVLKDTTVEDDLRLYHCYINSMLEGSRVNCTGKMQLSRAKCMNGVKFDGAQFEQRASFSRAQFESSITCRGATFSGIANFIGTEFKYRAEFNFTSFKEKVQFSEAVFDLDEERNYVPEFQDCRFEGEAIFGDHERYNSDVLTFEQRPDFSNALFRDSVTYRETIFKDGVNISETTFQHDADFSNSKIGSGVKASNSKINGSIELDMNPIQESTLLLDFTGASIRSGTFAQPTVGQCYYDCTDSLLGNVLVADDHHNRFPLDYVRMVRTRFDGFDFMRYREGLERENWQIHAFKGNPPAESADIDALDRELTYLRAKSGANQIGDGRAASGFFQREMRARRGRFRSLAESSDSLSERLKAHYKQLMNWGFDEVCHYGEGPIRTARSMMMVIAAFAVIYAVQFNFFIDGTPYPEMDNIFWVEYLLFSAESFITVVHNPTAHIDSLLVRFLSVIQGFIGALFVALFLFTLTRYVHR